MSVRAVLLALVLATPAMAADSGTVQVRTRPDTAGDVYRFRSETRFVQKDDHGAQTQSNTQVFELKVLEASADGLRLRYTLHEADLKDSAGPAMAAPLKAAVGGVLDFRVGRDGAVTGLENWPAYKARLLAGAEAALPAGDPVRAMLREQLDQAPLQAALEVVLADVQAMAQSEPRGAVPLGASDIAGDATGVNKAVLQVSTGRAGCTVRVERNLNRTLSGMTRAVVSEAEVSVIDGRVLTLSETRITRSSGGSQDETVTIRRLSPAPACPG